MKCHYQHLQSMYFIKAVAITSEGRCASDPTKKKTPKDKLQNEPGHHQLKTHSFKAKEFQAMQEKSKSQTNLIPPIQRPKPKLKVCYIHLGSSCMQGE